MVFFAEDNNYRFLFNEPNPETQIDVFEQEEAARVTRGND